MEKNVFETLGSGQEDEVFQELYGNVENPQEARQEIIDTMLQKLANFLEFQK